MEPPPATATATTTVMTITVVSSPIQSHAIRIPPNTDLVPSLLEAARQAMQNSKAQSAFLLTAVGSLSEVTLRMAATDNENDNQSGANKNHKTSQTATSTSLAESTAALRIRTFKNPVEIVSLVGTFSLNGGKHLHMCVSNAEGQVVGGHLMAGTVYTTLELVLGTMPDVAFRREMDAHTGYQELTVNPSSKANPSDESTEKEHEEEVEIHKKLPAKKNKSEEVDEEIAQLEKIKKKLVLQAEIAALEVQARGNANGNANGNNSVNPQQAQASMPVAVAPGGQYPGAHWSGPGFGGGGPSGFLESYATRLQASEKTNKELMDTLASLVESLQGDNNNQLNPNKKRKALQNATGMPESSRQSSPLTTKTPKTGQDSTATNKKYNAFVANDDSADQQLENPSDVDIDADVTVPASSANRLWDEFLFASFKKGELCKKENPVALINLACPQEIRKENSKFKKGLELLALCFNSKDWKFLSGDYTSPEAVTKAEEVIHMAVNITAREYMLKLELDAQMKDGCQENKSGSEAKMTITGLGERYRKWKAQVGNTKAQDSYFRKLKENGFKSILRRGK